MSSQERKTMKTRSTLLFVLLTSAALMFAQATSTTPATSTKPKTTTKKRAPAKTTASGVQYWDLKLGTGDVASKGKLVTVDYTGWLTSGKKFDSSVGGKPFQFHLGQGEVIKGWDEGVDGMKVGGKRRLRIPPAAGYGARGAGGVIPPNATLIFEVQLLKVQ
jgi:FKBP-type peptidyl-prolyl cis-trans isomerase FkpA